MASETAWKPRSTLVGALLVNRYQISQLVGQGSTGAVYRAEDVLSKRAVAVRVLTPSLSQLELISRIRARIAKNAEISRKSSDALINLVDILDVGLTIEGETFVVTDYLEGDHLASMLTRGGRLPWSRARSLLVRLCQLIHGFHQQGVVLGTLQARHCYAVRNRPKSEAIKIISSEILEQVSKSLGPSAGPAGVAMARYVSPERACGEPVDARSDVYSFGVIAYELLVGRLPFDDANAIRLIAMHLQAAPPPPRQVAPDAQIPPGVEQALLRALAKAPADRFPSMEAFADALSAVPEQDAAVVAAPYPGAAPIPSVAAVAPPAPPPLAAPPSSLASLLNRPGLGLAAPAPPPVGLPIPAPPLIAPAPPPVAAPPVVAPAPATAAAPPLVAPAPSPVAPPVVASAPSPVPPASAATVLPSAAGAPQSVTPPAAALSSPSAPPSSAASLLPTPSAPGLSSTPSVSSAPTTSSAPAAAAESPAVPATSDAASADPLGGAVIPPLRAPTGPVAASASRGGPAKVAPSVVMRPMEPLVAPVAPPSSPATASGNAAAPRSPSVPTPAAVIPPLRKPSEAVAAAKAAPAANESPAPPAAQSPRLAVVEAVPPSMSDAPAKARPERSPPEVSPAVLRSAALRGAEPAALSDAPSESILAELPRRRVPWVAMLGVGAVIAAGAAAYIQTQPDALPPTTARANPQSSGGATEPPSSLPPPTKVAVAPTPPTPDERGSAVTSPEPPPVEPPVEPPPTATDPLAVPTDTPPAPGDAPGKKDEKKKKKKKNGSRRDVEPEEEEEDVFDQLRKHMEAKKAAEEARAASITPAPAATPTPTKADDAARAKDTLDRARQAATQGNHALAYSLAKQSYGIVKTSDALELMGVYACKAGNADNARSAANQLAGSRRTAIVDACAKSGITI